MNHIDFYALVGEIAVDIFLFTVLMFAGYALGRIVADIIDSLRLEIRRYRVQKKCNTTPTAKCYCADCCHHEYPYCNYFRKMVIDTDFCSYAIPRKAGEQE